MTERKQWDRMNAERIQSMLMRQDFKTPNDWLQHSQVILEEWASYRLQIRPPIDASKWVGTKRPEWVNRKTDFTFDRDTGYREWLAIEFDPCTNPLFAYVAIRLWLGWNQGFESWLVSLFHLLMDCGCSRPKVLNQQDEHGITPAMIATLEDSCTSLIFSAPNVCLHPVMPPHDNLPCVSLLDLFYLKRGSLQQFPIDHQRFPCLIWDRWTHIERQFYLVGNFWISIAMRDDTMTLILWNFICKHINWQQPRWTLNDLMVNNGRTRNVLSLAAISDGPAWRLLTSCPEAMNIFLHEDTIGSNASSNHYEVSSLTAAISSTQSSRVADERSAWLSYRVNDAHLNRHSEDGYPPIVLALMNGRAQTIHAMVSRIDEIDLLAPRFASFDGEPIHKNRRMWIDNKIFVDYDILQDTLKNPPNVSDSLQHQWSKDLTFVLETLAHRKVELVAEGEVICPFFMHEAGFPKELVRLCLTYARIPEPKIWPLSTSAKPFIPVDVSQVTLQNSERNRFLANQFRDTLKYFLKLQTRRTRGTLSDNEKSALIDFEHKLVKHESAERQLREFNFNRLAENLYFGRSLDAVAQFQHAYARYDQRDFSRPFIIRIIAAHELYQKTLQETSQKPKRLRENLETAKLRCTMRARPKLIASELIKVIKGKHVRKSQTRSVRQNPRSKE
jgi:hypothetical protein